MTLEVTQLSVVLHRKLILENVSFRVPSSAITAIIGPNGAGKTTLLKAILGILPYKGNISIDGKNINSYSRNQKSQLLAYVPQKSQLQARLIAKNVVAQGRFLKLNKPEVIEKALKAAGATHLQDRFFTELSGGEQQRILIARALATEAKILILDEPTAFLDIGQSLYLQQQLKTFANQNLTIILVLHDLEEARKLADHIVLIYKQSVFQEGKTKEVLQQDTIKEVFGVEIQLGEALTYKLPNQQEP